MSADENNEREHQDISPEPLEHQELRKSPNEYDRRESGFRTIYEEMEGRDKIEFAQNQISNINEIVAEFQSNQEKYGELFDPKLTFEIETKPDKWKEKRFREDLEEVEIEIVSAAGSDKGKWVGYSKKNDFSKLKQSLKDYRKQQNPIFLDFIKDIKKREDKLRPTLLNNPLSDDEIASLDVELDIIRSESNVNESVSLFKKFIETENAKVTDELITENLCIIRIQANKKTLEKILDRGQVKSISRIHKPSIREPKEIEKEEMPELDIIPPDSDAPSVLVLDSGIVEHPLMKNALKIVDAVSTIKSKKIRKDQPYDDVGHGTRMASIVLYGNIEKEKEKKSFKPEIWINSSKLMYENHGDAEFDKDELIEHQLRSAVEQVLEQDHNCKIINISFGDSSQTAFDAMEQLPIAMIVDELSLQYQEIIFVISSGNYESPYLDYPKHIFEEKSDSKIIDPATSAHAITIGSLRNYSDHPGNAALYPSSITRSGLGFKEMIKPELVEFGGDKYHDIICFENQFLKNGPYTADIGSSTSAALISHYLARLIKKFPDYSRNLIKALLIASAVIPQEKPSPIRSIRFDSDTSVWKENLQVYGYGKPNIEHALYSEDNRVILKNESNIGLGKVHYYTLSLPEEFFATQGIREISVTLTFDPPVGRDHSSYLGLNMDFRLFKNTSLEDVQGAYSLPLSADDEENTPVDLTNMEVELFPKIRFRSNSTHQKASRTYTRPPNIDPSTPLVLAVKCNNRWLDDLDHSQKYGIVVTVKHSAGIDLYNRVRNVNRIRQLARARIGSDSNE